MVLFSSVKGYAKSTAFATGKFALRALAQCNAREFGPQGIHVLHVIIDGGIDKVPLGEDGLNLATAEIPAK